MRAFTLIEMLVAVVVLSIISAGSVASYQGYRDRTAMLVDETNQKILAAATIAHTIETGTVAGTLAELRPSDLERAYALVIDGHPRYTFLAFLQESFGVPVAEAVPLPGQYYSNKKAVLSCPSDPTTPANGKGISYTVNTTVFKTAADIQNSANDGQPLIIECEDNHVVEYRHHDGIFAPKTIAVRTLLNGKQERHKKPREGKGNMGESGGGGGHGGGKNKKP